MKKLLSLILISCVSIVTDIYSLEFFSPSKKSLHTQKVEKLHNILQLTEQSVHRHIRSLSSQEVLHKEVKSLLEKKSTPMELLQTLEQVHIKLSHHFEELHKEHDKRIRRMKRTCTLLKDWREQKEGLKSLRADHPGLPLAYNVINSLKIRREKLRAEYYEEKSLPSIIYNLHQEILKIRPLADIHKTTTTRLHELSSIHKPKKK